MMTEKFILYFVIETCINSYHQVSKYGVIQVVT